MLLLGLTSELRERADIHDVKLIDQEARVTYLEGQFSTLSICFNGLDNQLSSTISALLRVGGSDPNDFALTAGLSSAAVARFEGVTVRENNTKLEERERLLY